MALMVHRGRFGIKFMSTNGVFYVTRMGLGFVVYVK